MEFKRETALNPDGTDLITAYSSSYESDERLMDERTLHQICEILEIPDEAINNYQPLDLPSMAGAGRVKAFREDEKFPFLSRPQAADAKFHNPISTNEESPQSTPSAKPKAELWEGWPSMPTYDEFEVTSDETKKLAAWSWYRTGIICAEAASMHPIDGNDQTDSTGSIHMSLLGKSERAKSHALRLYPKLLDEQQIDHPGWADPFTSCKSLSVVVAQSLVRKLIISKGDEEYYIEMAKNREYLARSEMAELYKQQAREYMMENLYHYLEERQTMEIEVTQAEPREIRQYMLHVIEKDTHGCLSMLWDMAIEWVQDNLQAALHDYGGSVFYSLPIRNFNLWWLRAANARGHAEWLLQERRDSALVGHSDPIEWWRLLPPGLIGQYDNSCVIWTWIIAADRIREVSAKRDAASEDKMEPIIDIFGQEFNTSSELVRGMQSLDFGWPYHSFVYGAPEFVYRTLAENSTTSSLIGLLSTDKIGSYPDKSRALISVYDRYMRRGISSTLDPSCPEHYRTLARCADDILAEWDAETRAENLIRKRYKDSYHLSSLLAALKPVLDKRVHMTLQEADDMDFEGVTFACINFFIGKMQRMLHRPPGLDEHRYLICVEWRVAKLLSPWFDFKMHQTRGGRIAVELKSLLSRRTMIDPSVSDYMTIANPVWACYEAAVISALDSFLDTARGLVLGNCLPPRTFLFALPFRDYLESGGDPAKMPVIKGGLSDNRRELTKLGLYKSGRFKCKPACNCPLVQRIQEMEESLLDRLSDGPKANGQRRAIAEFFSRAENQLERLNREIKIVILELMTTPLPTSID
ncbi:hypothetical protein V8C40DRAFT_263319 [Trichoderma camerunense]